jgi:hypothetical protein
MPEKTEQRGPLSRLSRVQVDLAAWQIGLSGFVIGVVALYLSAKLEGSHGPSAWDSVLREGGALLFVTATLAVAWDLRGRRQLTNEVLSAAGLSKAITDAGLTNLTTHYAEINWSGMLETASHVDLFFAYASTWRAYHDAALRRLVRREGTHLRVVLPDRENQPQVAQLSRRFGVSEEEVKQKIGDAETAFKGLAQESSPNATVELRVTTAVPVFTYYRFDGRCVGVLYAQAGQRVEVPAFECEAGALHQFFVGQFKALWDSSAARSLE